MPNDAGELSALVLLVFGVGAAYLLAHFVIDRLERRFLLSTGVEFILLGALLGPAFAAFPGFDDRAALATLVALGAGWVGLVHGTELLFGQDGPSRAAATRLGIADALGTGALVTIAARGLFETGWFGVVTSEDAWLASVFLGTASAAGSASAVDVLRRRYGALDPTLPMLARAALISDVAAIAAFGTLFCVYHQGETATAAPPNASDWLLITLGLGASLGLLFSAFISRTDSDDERFVALVGIIVFASGAAYFLELSVLLVNLVLGVVLVNTSPAGRRIRETLTPTRRPVTLLLLVFAGAMWRPVPLLPGLGFVAAFLVLRTTAKVVACWVGALGTPLRRDLSRGMLSQGDVTVAMALSFRLVFEGEAVDLAYTAVLVAVIVNELIAPRMLKGLLVDAGELRDEARAEAGG